MSRLELDVSDFADEYEIKLKGKKAKRGPRGGVTPVVAPQKRGGPATREKLSRTVRKVPEVMVKITQGRKDPATGERRVVCKDMRAIRAHIDYISRNGGVELEDQNGNVYAGREDIPDLLEDWRGGLDAGARIPLDDGHRREAHSIVLSMPPGTDRAAVKAAARAFAMAEFADHQYVFAAHDDEAHPHVHLTVKTTGRHGQRLNPRKADLQRWRELFAEKLREQGIEANATPRQVRGVVRKPEHHAVRNIQKRGAASRAYAGQIDDARQEAQGGPQHVNPAQDRISARRKAVTGMYGKLARSLVKGDAEDKALALDIMKFVKEMPPPMTLHQLLIQEQQRKPAGADRSPERSKPTEKNPDRG